MIAKGNIATYSNPDSPLATGLMDGIVGFLEGLQRGYNT